MDKKSNFEYLRDTFYIIAALFLGIAIAGGFLSLGRMIIFCLSNNIGG